MSDAVGKFAYTVIDFMSGASIIAHTLRWRRGEIGRHDGFKIRWGKTRGGSSPPAATIIIPAVS